MDIIETRRLALITEDELTAYWDARDAASVERAVSP